MKDKTKAALITGACGIVGTISAAIIGLYAGKSNEQKSIQNEINEVMGDMVNIIGDDNDVTINDIKELVEDFQSLKKENESLIAQNVKYFDDLTKANDKIEEYENQSRSMVQELEQQLNDKPDVQFKDVNLVVDGIDTSINAKQSVIIVNGKDYVSKEMFEKIIPNDKNLTLKEDTFFIGKVIADAKNLFELEEFGKGGLVKLDTYKDSSGNSYPKSYRIYDGKELIFNLDRKYSFLDLSMVLCETENKYNGNIIVKADDIVVFTSKDIDRNTELFRESININQCRLLTIIYEENYSYVSYPCILSDVIIYN